MIQADVKHVDPLPLRLFPPIYPTQQGKNLTRGYAHCKHTTASCSKHVKGIEPSSSAWKADIRAIIRHVHAALFSHTYYGTSDWI